jgi:hypothetical protein
MRWMVLGFVGFVGLLEAGQAGAGCVRPINMDAVYKRIDPKNALGADERALNAYAQLFNYRLNHFDTDGVWPIIKAWQYHYMVARSRFDAIEGAASGATPDSNLSILLRIYANIPPEAKLQKTSQGVVASWTDKWGKSNDRIILSPEQIGANVLGILPGSFKKFLDDSVADGPPPGFQGECPPTRAVRRPPPLPDLDDDALVAMPGPRDAGRSLSCITLGMGRGDSVTNCQ